MRPFLALKLDAVTGVAVGPPDGEPAFSDIVLLGGPIGLRLDAFDERLNALLDAEQPARIEVAPPTRKTLHSLVSHTAFVCARRSIPYGEMDEARIVRWFAGLGGAARFGWTVAGAAHEIVAAGWANMVHRHQPAYAERFRLGPMGTRR